jgi:mannose PTS system EIIA component
MPQILVVAHAPLASALRSVAEHTFPDCHQNLHALDVSPEMSAEDVETAARALMATCPLSEAEQGWLVLTDVFGATPSNAAQRLAAAEVRVVCGVNVPMLWRSLCYASQPLDVLADRALTGAAAGIIAVSQPTADA